MQLLSGKNRFKPECYHFQRSDAPSESTDKISNAYGGKNVITPEEISLRLQSMITQKKSCTIMYRVTAILLYERTP